MYYLSFGLSFQEIILEYIWNTEMIFPLIDLKSVDFSLEMMKGQRSCIN
jgi:hypothetical protein